jgi:hypothetical protein
MMKTVIIKNLPFSGVLGGENIGGVFGKTVTVICAVVCVSLSSEQANVSLYI